MTTVVSFHDVKEHWNWRTGKWDSPEFVYIGRANKAHHLPQSPYANPFRLSSNTKAARGSTLGQFRRWLTTSDQGKKLLLRIHELDGKTLVCWCQGKAHGEPCHGEVLIEFMGEQTVDAAPEHYEIQMALDGGQAAVLAWDDGAAGFEVKHDRRGMAYRTSTQIERPIGLPGVVYTDWITWYRDYLKISLRVKGRTLTMNAVEYARYRYETSLQAMENETDGVAQLHRDVLRELLAELDEGE